MLLGSAVHSHLLPRCSPSSGRDGTTVASAALKKKCHRNFLSQQNYFMQSLVKMAKETLLRAGSLNLAYISFGDKQDVRSSQR